MQRVRTPFRIPKRTLRASVLLVVIATLGCGYSQEEWEQKLREIAMLRAELDAERQAHRKAETEYADAISEVDDLKKKLLARGVDLNNLSTSLEETRRATEEYRARAEQLGEMQARFGRLKKKLQTLTNLGLELAVRDNRMVIRLPGDVLFDSGRDRLKRNGRDILSKVAEVIGKDPELANRDFQVAGHTDSTPMRPGPYRDNWGLSAMRARSVVVYLTEVGGLSKAHWSAAGYADTDAVAGNDTAAGRKQNRRVELVVLPDVQEMLNLNDLK